MTNLVTRELLTHTASVNANILERHKQGHQEIHSQLYTMLLGKNEDSVLSFANNRDTGVTI